MTLPPSILLARAQLASLRSTDFALVGLFALFLLILAMIPEVAP